MSIQVDTGPPESVATTEDDRDGSVIATTSAVDLSPRIAPIAEALIARSSGRHDPEFVRRLVGDVAARYASAPVQDYVVVLVTKEATDALRRLDALHLV
jgi:hypothetical protein